MCRKGGGGGELSAYAHTSAGHSWVVSMGNECEVVGSSQALPSILGCSHTNSTSEFLALLQFCPVCHAPLRLYVNAALHLFQAIMTSAMDHLERIQMEASEAQQQASTFSAADFPRPVFGTQVFLFICSSPFLFACITCHGAIRSKMIRYHMPSAQTFYMCDILYVCTKCSS